MAKKIFLIAIVFHLILDYSYGQSKVNTLQLFSPTGDTITCFKRGIGDTSFFSVAKKSGDTLVVIDSFNLIGKYLDAQKSILPQSITGKYKLFIQPDTTTVNGCNDIVIEQETIENRRVQKRQNSAIDMDDSDYIYRCVKKVTIKVFGKILLKDFIMENDYEATSKHRNDISKAEIIPIFSKIKGMNKYYFRIQMYSLKMHYESPKNAQQSVRTVKSITCLLSRAYLM